MKNLILSLVLTVSIAGAAVLGEPCIPDGDTHNVDFTTDSNVVPGSGEGMESDIGPDDELGSATETSSGGNTTFSVPITNNGGVLSGPNGVPQNGGAEGDCIEVYVTFKIRYKVKVCNETPVTVGGDGPESSSEDCWEEWREKEAEFSEPKTVCPC